MAACRARSASRSPWPRDGRLRRAFNVQEGEVVVLTYTRRRRLANVIDDDDGTYGKAKDAWAPLERTSAPASAR